MSLVDAIRAVAQQPAAVQPRVRLAMILDQMGTIEASRVWAGTVRLAAARGQFFPALFLCQLHVRNTALQTQLLVELANRFGTNREKHGYPSPPPMIKPIAVDIPEVLDQQIYLAVKLGAQVKGYGLPEGAIVPDIPLFGALPPAEFVAFSLLLQPTLLHPNQTFIVQDATEQSIYLLANGRVNVTKREPDGSITQLAEIKAPAVIGEMSVLTAVPRRASVTALEKGLAWRVDSKAVEHLAHAHPELMSQLNLIIKRRLLNNLIHSSEIFRAVGPRLDQLLQAFEVVHIKSNTQVFGQGEPPPGLFVILHGEAEVWNQEASSERIRVATLNEGDAFGEMSLLTGQPTTASVVMPEGGVLLHLPADAFFHIRTTVPGLELQLTELMVVRRSELLSMAAPFQSFEEIDPDDSSWLTGDFESFKG